MTLSRATSGLDQPLPIGLITMASAWATAVGGVDACGDFELRAACGLPAGTQAPAGVETFDSAKDLLARADVAAVAILGDPRTAIEYASAALSAKKHVYLHGVLGRTFAEGAALLKQAEGAPTMLGVESWWDRVRDPIRRLLGAIDDFRPSLIDIRLRGLPPAIDDWRYNADAAGGGALEILAPEWLDIVLAMRRLPDSVFAATGRFRREPGTPPRESEDHALAVLRWPGSIQAGLSAVWAPGHSESLMTIEGGELRVELSDTSAALRRADGAAVEEVVLPSVNLASQLDAFAQAIVRDDGRAATRGAVERALAVRACVDAIYLSARTSQPESPRNLYAANGWPEPRA